MRRRRSRLWALTVSLAALVPASGEDRFQQRRRLLRDKARRTQAQNRAFGKAVRGSIQGGGGAVPTLEVPGKARQQAFAAEVAARGGPTNWRARREAARRPRKRPDFMNSTAFRGSDLRVPGGSEAGHPGALSGTPGAPEAHDTSGVPTAQDASRVPTAPDAGGAPTTQPQAAPRAGSPSQWRRRLAMARDRLAGADPAALSAALSSPDPAARYLALFHAFRGRFAPEDEAVAQALASATHAVVARAAVRVLAARDTPAARRALAAHVAGGGAAREMAEEYLARVEPAHRGAARRGEGRQGP